MFCNYDFSHFPLVIIRFVGKIENDAEFYEFITTWNNLYENMNDFIFVFDTSNMQIISIKYSIMMSKFIKDFKKRKIHYLKKSIIIIKNKMIKPLIELIFYIQKPVSNIYITNDNIEDIISKKNLLMDNEVSNIINVTSIINP
jgi:hypothetical protein